MFFVFVGRCGYWLLLCKGFYLCGEFCDRVSSLLMDVDDGLGDLVLCGDYLCVGLEVVLCGDYVD